MDLGLKGRVAVVAAASSGLGKAVALQMAEEGASVVINSRGEEGLIEAAEEIKSATGGDVIPIAGDVTNEAHVNRLFAEAVSRFGRVDVLVANAGGPPAGYFDDFTSSHYREAIELNLISTINLCREAVPLMRERGWGRIVAITSIAAKQPVENLILSNTARAGVLGFIKSLSEQVAASGITANTVCPGYHLTERLRRLAHFTSQKEGVRPEDVFTRLANSVPMKRIGDAKEFASVVTFLCSQQASYVTGTVIQVDGGAYKALF